MKPSEQNHIQIKDLTQKLSEIGISLSSHYKLEDLIAVVDQHGQADMPSILTAMAGAYGRLPHFHLSDNIWLFDTECVEEPQAYADIAYRIKALTAPDLPLVDIHSDLNFEKGTAWLEFKCLDIHYHWDLDVEEDWVDAKVFDKFCHLIEELNRSKAIATCGKGQASFFVYTDETNLAKLIQITELKWEWLENPPKSR